MIQSLYENMNSCYEQSAELKKVEIGHYVACHLVLEN